MLIRLFLALTVLTTFIANSCLADQNRNIAELLHNALKMGDSLTIEDEPVMATELLSLFYASRNYEPAWSDLEYAKRIVRLLNKSTKEGLNPRDYHAQGLFILLKKIKKERGDRGWLRAKLDILLTDGVLLYASHLVNGKVAPSTLAESWNYERMQFLPEEVVKELNNHVDNKTIEQALRALIPQSDNYLELKKGLAEFTRLAHNYRFKKIELTSTVHPGQNHPKLPEIRYRLYLLGLLSVPSDDTYYDNELYRSVIRFQRKFHLDIDGLIGPGTLAALNVPFAQRADQIRANMERVRWITDDLSDDVLVVNIAGFRLWLFRDGEDIWTTEVMTGSVRTQTPVFKARMSYLVFNPTWTVPRSIIREMMPKFKDDPNYINEHNYRLVDRNGNRVMPESLDWSALGKNNFPYRLVQMPGEGNALGRVKFIFPNEHAIYLHDTPSKHLFAESNRAFSHGCIRVNKPLRLAELLLNDERLWKPEDIDAVVNNKTLRQVQLNKPVDVIIMYWTVQPTDFGELGFVDDVYDRDRALLTALDKPLF